MIYGNHWNGNFMGDLMEILDFRSENLGVLVGIHRFESMDFEIYGFIEIQRSIKSIGT